MELNESDIRLQKTVHSSYSAEQTVKCYITTKTLLQWYYVNRAKFNKELRLTVNLLDWNKLHRLTERDSRLTHYFVLFWGLWLLLGYLATSGAKSDVIFLLSDPISYKDDEISRPSRLVFEIWRRTDRRQTRRPKQKALTLWVCEPENIRIYRTITYHAKYDHKIYFAKHLIV